MQKYNKILDRVYELEGLLLLAISGDNNTSRLPELIYRKAAEITALSSIVETELSSVTSEEKAEEKPVIEAPVIQQSRPAPIQPEVQTPRTPLLSLNDRFLFIRELFGGDGERFDGAMNQMATFDNYEEAEEYFLTEYGWEAEDANVEAFFNAISNYFTYRNR